MVYYNPPTFQPPTAVLIAKAPTLSPYSTPYSNPNPYKKKQVYRNPTLMNVALYLVHGRDSIKFVIFCSFLRFTHEHVKCYPTMTKISIMRDKGPAPAKVCSGNPRVVYDVDN